MRSPGQTGLIPDAHPERVEPARRELFGKHPRGFFRPRQCREHTRSLLSEPDRARSGLGVFETDARAVLAKFADFLPCEVEDFGQARPGERQQPDRGHRPPRLGLVRVQDRAEAFEFVAIQRTRDGPSRVLDDVGAGIGEAFTEFAPLAGRLQHRPQDLKRTVGCPGFVRARSVEPRRDPRMVDGVQPHSAERGHQPVVGGSRRRSSATTPSSGVCGAPGSARRNPGTPARGSCAALRRPPRPTAGRAGPPPPAEPFRRPSPESAPG